MLDHIADQQSMMIQSLHAVDSRQKQLESYLGFEPKLTNRLQKSIADVLAEMQIKEKLVSVTEDSSDGEKLPANATSTRSTGLHLVPSKCEGGEGEGNGAEVGRAKHCANGGDGGGHVKEVGNRSGGEVGSGAGGGVDRGPRSGVGRGADCELSGVDGRRAVPVEEGGALWVEARIASSPKRVGKAVGTRL